MKAEWLSILPPVVAIAVVLVVGISKGGFGGGVGMIAVPALSFAVPLPQAAAILLTLPGTPWLYYGEEVGLNNPRTGGDEDKRTPMPWTDGDAGFTAGVPWYRFAPGPVLRHAAAAREAARKRRAGVPARARCRVR